jgi:hypothetical protein
MSGVMTGSVKPFGGVAERPPDDRHFLPIISDEEERAEDQTEQLKELVGIIKS